MSTTFEKVGYLAGDDIDVIQEKLERVQQEAARPGLWELIRTTETGPGPLSQYMEHPLNFARSAALARIIRGITGFVGETGLAAVDIAVGLLELLLGGDKNETVARA